MGRAGRGGDQSVCVLLRRRGEWTPPEMRQYLKQDSTVCLKKGMVQIFTLKDPDGGFWTPNMSNIQITVVYDTEEEDVECSRACIDAGWCTCSKCRFVCPRFFDTTRTRTRRRSRILARTCIMCVVQLMKIHLHMYIVLATCIFSRFGCIWVSVKCVLTHASHDCLKKNNCSSSGHLNLS